jgi:small subunit ribosomal protein S20
MPHTNSAKKRLRQNERRRASNRAMRSQMRTCLKKAREAAAKAPADAATEQVIRKACSELDKAARKGLIKKNEANRRKARLALLRNRSAK